MTKTGITSRDRVIIALYQQGMSMQQVADGLSLSRGSIYWALVAHGIPRRARGIPAGRHAKPEHMRKVRQMKSMRTRGMTLQAIAEQFSCTRQAVEQLLRKYDEDLG